MDGYSYTRVLAPSSAATTIYTLEFRIDRATWLRMMRRGRRVLRARLAPRGCPTARDIERWLCGV